MKYALKAVFSILIMFCVFLAFAGYFDRNILVRVPATARPATGDVAAVYFSGDLGYRVAMGRMIGNRLAADGIPVVAVNSMGYFRPRRTVAEMTGLIANAIRQAVAFGHSDQVILIGHSFGADTLQAGLVHLSQDLRARIRAVVLIAPTKALYLRISPGEMLDLTQPDAEALPTLRQLTWVPTTCIYGTWEADSPCPHLDAPNVRRIALPGGHSLDWNIDRVHASIVGAITAARTGDITNNSGQYHQAARP